MDRDSHVNVWLAVLFSNIGTASGWDRQEGGQSCSMPGLPLNLRILLLIKRSQGLGKAHVL